MKQIHKTSPDDSAMPKERNEFLESGGLFWESDTHEWFNDNTTTNYAQTKNLQGISLPNIVAFILRDKLTGEYDRVLYDKSVSNIIYDNKGLENIGVYIDKLKINEAFK